MKVMIGASFAEAQMKESEMMVHVKEMIARAKATGPKHSGFEDIGLMLHGTDSKKGTPWTLRKIDGRIQVTYYNTRKLRAHFFKMLRAIIPKPILKSGEIALFDTGVKKYRVRLHHPTNCGWSFALEEELPKGILLPDKATPSAFAWAPGEKFVCYLTDGRWYFHLPSET